MSKAAYRPPANVIGSNPAVPVVAITGVNSGLGRALATSFLDEGMAVAGIGRQAESTVKPHPNFGYWNADVSNATLVAKTFAGMQQRFGHVDVLIANAAVYPKSSFLEQNPTEWLEAISINVNGVAYCCMEALKIMVAQGKGRIYVVGSFADIAPLPASAAYSTSKGALHALVKGVAADLNALAVDVQIHEWVPGHLKTRMSDFTGIDPAVSARWAVQMVKADHASKNGSLFENDREKPEELGLKKRILKRLGLRR